MDLVPLSTQVLWHMAHTDRQLGAHFGGVYPADGLPSRPYHRAYVVNTDPSGRPGQHWLGLWLAMDGTCEVMDSFGLPLAFYDQPDLQAWLRQYPVVRSDLDLQAMDSQTCGHYALLFLRARANGTPFESFLSWWNMHDKLGNDRKAAGMLESWIGRRMEGQTVEVPPWGEQSNVSRQAFEIMRTVKTNKNKQ